MRRLTVTSSVFLYAILFLGFAVRVINLGFQSYWRDEIDTLRAASQRLPALLPLYLRPGFNGPLYFTLIHFWMMPVGESEFAVRFFSVGMGLLAVALCYRVARALGFDRVTSTLAMAFGALTPFYVWYSQEARMYMLALVLSLASLLFFLRSIRTNRWSDWSLFVATTTAALYSHILAALILPAELAILTINWSSLNPRARRNVAILLVAIALLAIPLAVWEIPLLIDPPPPRYPFLPLHVLLFATVRGFSVALDSNLVPWGILPFGILLIVPLVVLVWQWRQSRVKPVLKRSARRQVRAPERNLALQPRMHALVGTYAYFLVPLLVFFLITLRFPLFTERYLIFVSPPFFILLAAGVRELGRARAIGWLALATVVGLSIIADVYQATTIIKPDFRQAARYLSHRAYADDAILFVMPAIKPTFDYYYRQPYVATQTPQVIQSSGDQFDAAMQKVFNKHPRGWIVLSEGWLWDPYNTILAWVEAHASEMKAEHLEGVDLVFFSR